MDAASPSGGIYELDEELITTGNTLPLAKITLLEGMNLEAPTSNSIQCR